MDYIHGFTFRMEKSKNQNFFGQEAKESLDRLVETTACDTIMLAVMAFQEGPFSEDVLFPSDDLPTDDEVIQMISYAKSLGLRVFLKPMLNCLDGTWRAHINFFDIDVPCEPKWSQWFKSYTTYICHYASIAQKTDCEMLLIGCEMVQSERRESQWRQLIKEVRKLYHGLLTYNTDKYQEDHVKFWDDLDVISSSGYYPIDTWDENLDRIEAVVKKYDKPFFFAECGIPCRKGSEFIPNDWSHEGAFDLKVQSSYYETMFKKCFEREWVGGLVGWDWLSNYKDHPIDNDGYSIFQKPAAKIIHESYLEHREQEYS